MSISRSRRDVLRLEWWRDRVRLLDRPPQRAADMSAPRSRRECNDRLFLNGTSGVTEVWFDGVRVDELSCIANLGTTDVGRLQLGEVQSGRTDDTALDDAGFGTQRIGV